MPSRLRRRRDGRIALLPLARGKRKVVAPPVEVMGDSEGGYMTAEGGSSSDAAIRSSAATVWHDAASESDSDDNVDRVQSSPSKHAPPPSRNLRRRSRLPTPQSADRRQQGDERRSAKVAAAAMASSESTTECEGQRATRKRFSAALDATSEEEDPRAEGAQELSEADAPPREEAKARVGTKRKRFNSSTAFVRRRPEWMKTALQVDEVAETIWQSEEALVFARGEGKKRVIDYRLMPPTLERFDKAATRAVRLICDRLMSLKKSQGLKFSPASFSAAMADPHIKSALDPVIELVNHLRDVIKECEETCRARCNRGFSVALRELKVSPHFVGAERALDILSAWLTSSVLAEVLVDAAAPFWTAAEFAALVGIVLKEVKSSVEGAGGGAQSGSGGGDAEDQGGSARKPRRAVAEAPKIVLNKKKRWKNNKYADLESDSEKSEFGQTHDSAQEDGETRVQSERKKGRLFFPVIPLWEGGEGKVVRYVKGHLSFVPAPRFYDAPFSAARSLLVVATQTLPPPDQEWAIVLESWKAAKFQLMGDAVQLAVAGFVSLFDVLSKGHVALEAIARRYGREGRTSVREKLRSEVKKLFSWVGPEDMCEGKGGWIDVGFVELKTALMEVVLREVEKAVGLVEKTPPPEAAAEGGGNASNRKKGRAQKEFKPRDESVPRRMLRSRASRDGGDVEFDAANLDDAATFDSAADLHSATALCDVAGDDFVADDLLRGGAGFDGDVALDVSGASERCEAAPEQDGAAPLDDEFAGETVGPVDAALEEADHCNPCVASAREVAAEDAAAVRGDFSSNEAAEDEGAAASVTCALKDSVVTNGANEQGGALEGENAAPADSGGLEAGEIGGIGKKFDRQPQSLPSECEDHQIPRTGDSQQPSELVGGPAAPLLGDEELRALKERLGFGAGGLTLLQFFIGQVWGEGGGHEDALRCFFEDFSSAPAVAAGRNAKRRHRRFAGGDDAAVGLF